RSLVKETGHWPLVLGKVTGGKVPEGFPEYLLEEDGELMPRQIIEEGLRLDVPQWLGQRLEELRSEDGATPFDEVASGDSTEPAASHSFSLPCDLPTGTPHPKVSIALLPTRTPWEVPAYLPFGGWNECPEPHEHLALMKHWCDAYGAEPFGIGSDVVEMFVTRPPEDLQRARLLAREQYAYCA